MKKDTLFYGLVALFFVILIVSPDYNFSLLNTGIYFTHGEKNIQDIKEIASYDTLFAKEGMYGSVLVDRKKDSILTINHDGIDYKLKINNSIFDDLKTLKINGKIQCGTTRIDLTTTGLSAGLPVILGKKGSALNIGLGCGLTLGVLEKGNFEIDTVEIDPLIIEAAKEFNDIHNNALDDPSSKIIIDDARNYLLKTDKKYDVIVTEALLPYEKGSSNLYTKEFFLLMKNNLKEDGIVVQWVPANQLASCDKPGFEIFYKTFSSVFPYNHVFLSKTKEPLREPYFIEDNGEIKANYYDVYDYPNPEWKYGEAVLIGSLNPIDIEKYFDIGEGSLKEYLKKIRIFDLKDYYLFGSEDVIGYSDDVVINTDDKPVIEFIAAENLYSKNESQCGISKIKIKRV